MHLRRKEGCKIPAFTYVASVIVANVIGITGAAKPTPPAQVAPYDLSEPDEPDYEV